MTTKEEPATRWEAARALANALDPGKQESRLLTIEVLKVQLLEELVISAERIAKALENHEAALDSLAARHGEP